jgi:hypothetical protein
MLLALKKRISPEKEILSPFIQSENRWNPDSSTGEELCNLSTGSLTAFPQYRSSQGQVRKLLCCWALMNNRIYTCNSLCIGRWLQGSTRPWHRIPTVLRDLSELIRGPFERSTKMPLSGVDRYGKQHRNGHAAQALRRSRFPSTGLEMNGGTSAVC